jgi:hypothetical protein
MIMPLAVVAPKHFSESPDFEYACPTCNVGFLVPDKSTFQKIEPPYSKLAHQVDEWDPDWITYRFTLKCVCNKNECGEVAYVSGSGSVNQRYGYDGQPEYYEQFSIHSFYPAPKLCYIPSDTPSDVKSLLKKSFVLYWTDVSAASNALRASLEALLDELKVPEQEVTKAGKTVPMTLHRRLDVWSATHKDFAELCFALKEVGNLGSHGDTVESKHYFGSLEIYSHVLKKLYENDAKKIKVLAQSIRDEIKAKKP